MGEKLKKRTLVKKLTPYMEEMGYTMIKCGFGQGTFSKKVADDIYFTVDHVIHRFYDDQFTSDIYYAKSVHLYEDYYKYGRARLGCVILGSDTWWQALDDTEFLDYIATLKKAEEIIIGDQKITEDLNASPKENLRREITAKIKYIVLNNLVDDREFKCCPKKEIDGVPMIWYKASEQVHDDDYSHFNIYERRIECCAEDAYRQHILDVVYEEKKKSVSK